MKISKICVDGSCDHEGNIQYRGVNCDTGEELFRFGPISNGTSNVAEFLAIVEAQEYLRKNSLLCPIYSDSMVARTWYRKKKHNSKLSGDSAGFVLALLQHAENLISLHKYKAHVRKWQTKKWGENKADFGFKKRKKKNLVL